MSIIRLKQSFGRCVSWALWTCALAAAGLGCLEREECEPGARRCLDDEALLMCSSAGRWRPWMCLPGQRCAQDRCVGPDLSHCDPAVAECADDSYCGATEACSADCRCVAVEPATDDDEDAAETDGEIDPSLCLPAVAPTLGVTPDPGTNGAWRIPAATGTLDLLLRNAGVGVLRLDDFRILGPEYYAIQVQVVTARLPVSLEGDDALRIHLVLIDEPPPYAKAALTFTTNNPCAEEALLPLVHQSDAGEGPSR